MLPDQRAAFQQRLLTTARQVSPALSAAETHLIAAISAAEPNRLRDALGRALGASAHHVVLTGSLERRLLAIECADREQWILADLSGMPHQERDWPAWARAGIHVDNPRSWLSLATVSKAAAVRLSQPGVLLVALYHPEHFPLPRFHSASRTSPAPRGRH